MKIIDVPKSILDLIAMADYGTADWGVPEDLDHSLSPVPCFDPAMLPAAIRPWVEDIAHRMQCPIDFVAAAAVTMLGSVIGTACGIRPKQNDNWTVVPNIWGAAIGRPGRLKSPAISAAMKPLHALDREAQESHRSALQAHDQELLRRKLKSDILKKTYAKKTTDPTDAEIAELAALSAAMDDAPKCRRFFTNDCTFEMLGEILRDNPRGLLVLHDELMGLLDGFERAGREGERQFYLTAWNGTDSHRVDRIGRGELYIPRLAASLFGGIQPDKLEQYLYGMQQSNGNDGFVQRFQLAVFPDEISTTKIVDESPDQGAEKIVMDIVKMLAHCDFTTLGAECDDAGQMPFFRFEANRAQPMFYKWFVSLDHSLHEQDAPLMEEHLGKFRKLVPALALIFHLVDLAGTAAKKRKTPTKRKVSVRVNAASLSRALRWASYLEAHAKRIYGMATDYRVQAAQALAKKIKGGNLSDGFSDRDIYRNDWSMLKDPDEVKAACAELEMAGWIRRIPTEGKGAGRPRSPKYEINPAVGTGGNAAPAPTKPPKRRR
jgi:hypothetical protein